MSTPISDGSRGTGHRRAGPALLLCAASLLLAGCLPEVQGIATTPTADGGTRTTISRLKLPPGTTPLGRAELSRGAVVVSGPAGYCVDGGSLRANGRQPFALLAQCDLLKSGEVEGVNTLSILTVTAVQTTEETALPLAEDIAETFGPAPILFSSFNGDLRLVQLGAGGDAFTSLADPVHWRGVMRLNGHVVAMAAYSTPGGAATGMQGRELLMRMAENTRAASPGSTADPELATRNAPPVVTETGAEE